MNEKTKNILLCLTTGLMIVVFLQNLDFKKKISQCIDSANEASDYARVASNNASEAASFAAEASNSADDAASYAANCPGN